MSKIKAFRYDINMLRAIAVVFVVLFHFQIPLFSAGFIGVDIFFVISGFLMTSIVCDAALRDSFSFKSFYIARARRIWPALIVLCFAVLALGWFVLMTADYKMLATHIRESLLFTSNLKYLSEAGYFDQASHSKWLLHTWSLSVEWQFYLIYPLVIVLFSKTFKRLFSFKSLFFLHIVLVVLFFSINIYYVSFDTEKAFYSIESRAWEMLLGGIAYFLMDSVREAHRRSFFVFGSVLLILSLFVISAGNRWPGYLALLPTLGTFFVILANSNYAVFRLKAFDWIGERSYSIYLWHWPLVVLAYYYSWNSIEIACLLIFVSFVLGHLSYLYIETPTRKVLSAFSYRKNAVYLVSFLIVCVALALIVRRDGIPARLPEHILIIESMENDKNPRQGECLAASSKCVFGGDDIAAVVVGDSHADSIVTAVEAALPDSNKGVLLRAASGCVFAANAQLRKERNKVCEEMVLNIDTEVAAEHSGVPVIFVNRIPFYLDGEHKEFLQTGVSLPVVTFPSLDSDLVTVFKKNYLERLCAVSKNNPVYVLRTVPEMPFSVPRAMAKVVMRGNSFKEVNVSVEDYKKRNAFTDDLLSAAVDQCNVVVLNPEPYLCDEAFCYGVVDDAAVYIDDDHLSETGNKLLTDLFKQVFVPAIN